MFSPQPSIPLSALQGLKDPESIERLQRQHGGHHEIGTDGSLYASIGNRPIPPPKALRKIHAHRQEERRQLHEDWEAEAFERELGLGVRESRTSLHFADDPGGEARLRRRSLAQRDLEARLGDTARSYDVEGCGLCECDGCYDYSEASCHGAPVYRNAAGWTLHRDRPPEEVTIGTDAEARHFGWLLSKDRKPFYAARTEELVAPSSGWECFYGPPPAPSRVVPTSWEAHFLQALGVLKAGGNSAVQVGEHRRAQELYSEALELVEGYEELTASSPQLVELLVALHANRAEARLRLQLWEGALEDSQLALAREPGHLKAAVRLAKALKALGRLGEAVPALELLVVQAGLRGGGGSSQEAMAWLAEAQVMQACHGLEEALQSQTNPEELAPEGELADNNNSNNNHNNNNTRQARQLLGVHRAASRLRKASTLQCGEGELDAAAQALVRSLEQLQPSLREDAELRCSLGLLLRGHAVLELATEELSSASSSLSPLDEDDEECADSHWSLEVLVGCCAASPELPPEPELRRLLAVLPRLAPGLAQRPRRALRLARALLRHQLRCELFVADSLVEARGLLAGCLKYWTGLLDESLGEEDLATAAAEVLQELAAQVMRLDNVEALALALFVETFVGQRLGSGVSGGFVLRHGGSVRRVALSLLRLWSEDERVLRSLSPELVGKLWPPLRAKLRRDAGLEVEKEVPSGPCSAVPLKMEWFKLKPSQVLQKGMGAFYPEELVEAVLRFLNSHMKATCQRGCELHPKEGIAPRNPAEEWTEEVLDRPFGWGVLLPMIVAPTSVASEALLLIEGLVLLHPHNEKLARRLAGLHSFMPLLQLSWPQAKPANSHLGDTLASGPVPRRSACVVLRCAMDTELAMRVARDHVELCFQAVLEMLARVLKGDDQPECVIAAAEVLGLLATNLGCLSWVPEDTISSVLEEFMRSSHGATRAQLAKLLRLMHADKVTMHVLRHCIEGERLDLDEEQQSRVMREIFDVRTLAGQAKAEGLLRAVQQQERLPADLQQASGSKQADKLARAIWDAYLKQRSSKSRVLVMGRLARALSRSLAAISDSCMVVLGDTTLDRLSDMGQQVQVLLLPAPQDVASEPQIASQELFDLLLVAEPMGYLDVGEYAEKLRPFIRRRELEDEKVADQVQCLVIEARERLEDARDELFSAGYYLADHVEAFPKLRRAAAEDGRAVTLLSLPSAEKELLKRSAQDKALERKSRRLREDEDRAQLEEDEQQQRNLLHATLFDPLLLDPLLLDPEAPVARCEVAYELGASKDEAEVVVFWLHGNNEDAEVWRPHLFVSPVEAGVGEGSSGRRLRVVAAIPPEGHQQWFQCSDEDAVRRGMEWYEMSDGPTEEAVAKARADAARNVSFGKPSLEELRCLQEIELCCKQLLRLIDDEVGPRTSKVVLGGFSQGGSVAAYLALSGIASAEMQQRFQALVICCSGVPVFHFLASKMQVGCLAARDEADARIDFPTVHMIYGRDDPEVKDSFVQTISDLCKRFDFPTVVQRFDRDENEERFPARARRQMLEEVLRLVIAAD